MPRRNGSGGEPGRPSAWLPTRRKRKRTGNVKESAKARRRANSSYA